MYGGDPRGGLESILEDFCESHVDSFASEGKSEDDGQGFTHNMRALHDAYLAEFEKSCEWAIEVEGGDPKAFFTACQVTRKRFVRRGDSSRSLRAFSCFPFWSQTRDSAPSMGAPSGTKKLPPSCSGFLMLFSQRWTSRCFKR